MNDDVDTRILSCHDGSLVRHGKMCAVARQDVCCGKARPLLWQDTREPQMAAAAFGGRPPLWVPCSLPPQRSCLATTRHLALPQRTSRLATRETRILTRAPPAPGPKCAVRDPVSSHVRPPPPAPKMCGQRPRILTRALPPHPPKISNQRFL